MSGFYGEVDNAPAGYGQGNVGFSGTPLWKLKQQGVVQGPAVPHPPTKEEQERAKRLEELQVANVLVDSFSLGGPHEGPGAAAAKVPPKPLVRHVIVKDLRKVATRLKLSLPTTGLFANQAAVALFALFDGQSCADSAAPGPQAAEWCCKHAHTKLIRNLMALPPDQVNQTFLKATLIKTFEDLDRELYTTQSSILDGCGGALGLLVGDDLLTAVVGLCGAFLCEPTPAAAGTSAAAAANLAASVRPLGAGQGRCELPGERAWLQQRGGALLPGAGPRPGAGAPAAARDGPARVRSVTGAEAGVSRSLGDRAWKSLTGEHGGPAADGALALLRCVPEVGAARLSYAEGCPVLILASAPVAQNVRLERLGEACAEFALRPRAASGEVVALAAEAVGDLTQQSVVVAICFQPPKSAQEDPPASSDASAAPAGKRLKTGPAKGEVQSLRLRHLLVKHRETGQAFDPVRSKPVARTPQEAEAPLRRALRELLREQRDPKAKAKLPLDPKKASMANLSPTPKFLELCKDISECQSATKGGGMCGDMGWVSAEQLRSFGPVFADVAKGLSIGDWSDLVPSQQGVHVIQRIA